MSPLINGPFAYGKIFLQVENKKKDIESYSRFCIAAKSTS